ncbi:FAD/NAD(P)-binding protein [Candidatus Woesearchaeota archaeon]|nr:FAD/NAD(P)-binding protein [Candidatus Woesearchaeota archaeon]
MTSTKAKNLIRKNPYLPEPKKVIFYKRESHDSFTIRLKWKLDHGVGQFVFVSIPGIGEAPISICSHTKDYVELNIREVGNVTRNLSGIKKGSILYARGPYGTTYPMEDFAGDDLIIIGGGCGVAPLKGVIEYIESNRELYKDIFLFLGFRTPDDTLFDYRLSSWKKDFNLHISYDKIENKGKTCILGAEGFVTTLVDNNIHNNNQKIALLCGPPIMIDKTIGILKNKGFNDDQIFLSAERLMYCGIGKCGGCMIHGKYTCLDGAVFRYDQLRDEPNDG